jgi:GntR family transcriptional regulator
MLIAVDPHSGVPVYRQLMDQIKFHIASGLLKVGDELPSTRSLSAELGVNPMTISKAYGYLEQDEIVERRPGRPLVVKAPGKGAARKRKLDQLAKALEPVVTMIRQLGITREEALDLFTDLLGGMNDKNDAEQGRAQDEDA